jgi:hypothetical protein
MIDIKNKTCIHLNCKTQPTFNHEGEKKPKYCAKHKLENTYAIISAGEKVKISHLIQPNPLGQKVFAFTDNNFANIFKDYIDYDTNWEKNFMSPLRLMIGPLNWDIDKQTASLDDW